MNELSSSPITKSQFKLGLSCIQKLRHARSKLPQKSQGDDLMQLLAEGGAAVEALVRATEPGQFLGGFGTDALAQSRVAILEALREAGAGRCSSLYEVTIEHGGFLARLDLVRMQPGLIELVEIKSSSEVGRDGDAPVDAFLKRDGRIYAHWVPYVQDLAFQRDLLTRWLGAHRAELPGGTPDRVVPKMLLVNSHGVATAATVMSRENYRVKYSIGSRGTRATVEYVGANPDRKLLLECSMSEVVEKIDRDVHSEVEEFAGQDLHECMQKMRAIVTSGRWPSTEKSLGSKCRKCEFRVDSEQGSGFDECWGRGSADVRGHILTLSRLSTEQCREAIKAAKERGMATQALVRDLPSERVTDSQRMQHDVMRRRDPIPVVVGEFAADPLRKMRAGANGEPTYFLDFETSSYPIPARSGGAPFELVPFQFEGHKLPSATAALGMRERLEGFLDLGQPDPRRDFLDNLKMQFGTHGVIYHWGSFERTVLNSVKQILLGAPAVGDADRLAFMDTLVGPEGKGGGRLVDLIPIAKAAFYHPAMNGSYSIKKVVPIAWAVPEIRAAFGPGHGASKDPHAYDAERDPYDGLPSAPRALVELAGLFGQDVGWNGDEEGGAAAIRNGGMAMLAYHFVRMFGDTDGRAWERQLRAYCGLDSAAMVMVFALMRDHVKDW
jgi:hypothetical protein